MVLRKQVAMKLCWIDLYLIFVEDQRSFMVVVGFLENIGSVFFIQVILYFGLDHRAAVMLPDFH